MRLLDEIAVFLVAACEAGSSALASSLAKTMRNACVLAGLLVASMVLLLGAMGLMIAALFIGLAPHLGAHWAAMIAAAAALAGSGILMAIALMVSKGR